MGIHVWYCKSGLLPMADELMDLRELHCHFLK